MSELARYEAKVGSVARSLLLPASHMGRRFGHDSTNGVPRKVSPGSRRPHALLAGRERVLSYVGAAQVLHHPPTAEPATVLHGSRPPIASTQCVSLAPSTVRQTLSRIRKLLVHGANRSLAHWRRPARTLPQASIQPRISSLLRMHRKNSWKGSARNRRTYF